MNEVQHQQFMDGIKMALDALPKKPVMSKEEYDKIAKKAFSILCTNPSPPASRFRFLNRLYFWLLIPKKSEGFK